MTNIVRRRDMTTVWTVAGENDGSARIFLFFAKKKNVRSVYIFSIFIIDPRVDVVTIKYTIIWIILLLRVRTKHPA